MRSLLMAVTVASALAATGCTDVLSLNPWVEGEGLMDPQFAGSWTSGDGGGHLHAGARVATAGRRRYPWPRNRCPSPAPAHLAMPPAHTRRSLRN